MFDGRPTAHVELFEHRLLVHSSRPEQFLRRGCPVCGGALGFRKPVTLFGDYHAHKECARGKPPLRRIAGGASVSPHEGLDLTIWLLVGYTWYLRLFTSQTATGTPSVDSTLTGGTSAPWTSGVDPVVECVGSNYAPVMLGPGDWDTSILDEGSGKRRLVAHDQTYPQTTDDWGVINGFFLATEAASTAQNTGQALFYANFYDEEPVIMNGPGFILQLTPYIQLDP